MKAILRNKIPLYVLFMLLGGPLAAQQLSPIDVARAFDQAFKTKTSDALKPYLSKTFSIGAYTWPSSESLLQTVLNQYPCESVSVADGRQYPHTLALIFHRAEGQEPVTSRLHLDEQGQIQYIDLFDQLYGMDRYRPSRHLVTVPFENVNGSIILQVKINDYPRPLRLLFDTGADGMALSKALADSIGLQVARTQQTSVVGGHREIQVSIGNTIYLDTLAVDQQSIAIFEDMHRDTDGIIGNSLAKRFITRVDYDRQTLSLYSFGKYTYGDGGFTVPVTVPSGNIGLPATVAVGTGEPAAGRFFFDTGAGYHAIVFRPFVKAHRLLLTGFKPDSVTATVSMGISTPVFNGRAKSFSFTPKAHIDNMPISLMGNSQSNKDWDPGVAGSIGIRLISQYNFTLNLMDKEIHFKPNENFRQTP